MPFVDYERRARGRENIAEYLTVLADNVRGRNPQPLPELTPDEAKSVEKFLGDMALRFARGADRDRWMAQDPKNEAYAGSRRHHERTYGMHEKITSESVDSWIAANRSSE